MHSECCPTRSVSRGKPFVHKLLTKVRRNRLTALMKTHDVPSQQKLLLLQTPGHITSCTLPFLLGTSPPPPYQPPKPNFAWKRPRFPGSQSQKATAPICLRGTAPLLPRIQIQPKVLLKTHSILSQSGTRGRRLLERNTRGRTEAAPRGELRDWKDLGMRLH